jgi:mono/diheme cytochrome c family protein
LRYGRPVIFRILVVALALAGLGGCKRSAAAPEQRGEGIFIRNCATCHGPRGRPLPTTKLPVMPRDLSDPGFYEQRSDAELKQVIKNGKGAMPAFGVALEDEDLDQVIAHLHRLARPR